MKILAVGNSFSQDATALLEFLAPQLTVRNLYIPGCPLSYHSELSQTVRRHMSTRREENAVYRSFSLWKKG